MILVLLRCLEPLHPSPFALLSRCFSLSAYLSGQLDIIKFAFFLHAIACLFYGYIFIYTFEVCVQFCCGMHVTANDAMLLIVRLHFYVLHFF